MNILILKNNKSIGSMSKNASELKAIGKARVQNMRILNLYKNPPIKLQFGERYALSIIHEGHDESSGLYEIGAFVDGELTELPGITVPGDTVNRFLTSENVDAIILKMALLSGNDPVLLDQEMLNSIGEKI